MLVCALALRNPSRGPATPPRRCMPAARACQPPSPRRSAPVAAQRRPCRVPQAVKGVEAFDGAFELDEAQQSTLNELLYSDMFCQQVVRECKLPEGSQVEFTGVLFQPVPWSVTTKKGMPPDVEERYYGREEFTFINVPPPFMFKAKVFQPPRLCAVYKRK